MLCLLEVFNTVDALAQLALAELIADAQIVRRPTKQSICEILDFLRQPCKLDNAPYLFL